MDSPGQSPDGSPLDGAPPMRIATAKGIVGVVAAVLAIQGVAFGVIAWLLPGWAERGQFGDLFGVTNSLFSGLAFAGLVYTIYLQERQIGAQARDSRLSGLAAQETLRLTSESLRIAHDQLLLARNKDTLDVSIALLNHYQGELARLRDLHARGLGPGNIDRQEVTLTTKVARLRSVVDGAYDRSTAQE